MAKGHEGWIAVVPETNGWGSSAHTEGFYLYADEESMNVGKEFEDRPDKIVYGRSLKANSRVSGPQKPGGNLTFQFRSNDCIPFFMAHFQKYIGSSLGGTETGTARYIFVPAKSEPDDVGSAFGTGGYGGDAGDKFTLGLVKKFYDTTEYNGTNSMWFKSCVSDSLEMNFAAGEDAKLNVGLKAYSVDHGTALSSSLNPSNSTFGSYSTLNSFQFWTGTLQVAGESLDITNFSFTSSNNTEDRTVLGKKDPSKYKFGRYTLEGAFDIDLPKDGLKWVGSMLNDSEFSITGTLYNGVHDSVKLSLPRCKYRPIEMNLAGGDSEAQFNLPFTAYESEDGATEPIKIVVETTRWGSSFNFV